MESHDFDLEEELYPLKKCNYNKYIQVQVPNSGPIWSNQFNKETYQIGNFS